MEFGGALFFELSFASAMLCPAARGDTYQIPSAGTLLPQDVWSDGGQP